MASALADLRIVDFSRVLAGPLATMVLADLGAEVTKVERPGTGDTTRSWGPPYDETGTATYFASVNRNKASVTLDLRSGAGVARARALVADADVVVENFRPGVMDRLGLGYEQLRADRPALVYCSITGFGAGEGATLAGYDLLVQALGGLMSITGARDGPAAEGGRGAGGRDLRPVRGHRHPGGAAPPRSHRRRPAGGARPAVLAAGRRWSTRARRTRWRARCGARLGNGHPSVAPYELLRAADGELIVAVGTDEQFRALTEVLGCPGAGRRSGLLHERGALSPAVGACARSWRRV